MNALHVIWVGDRLIVGVVGAEVGRVGLAGSVIAVIVVLGLISTLRFVVAPSSI